MTVEQTNIIDLIGTDKSNQVILTISDHLEWDNEHLLILQEKINTYLMFIESGQIYTSHPAAKEKKIIIRTVFKYVPDDNGLKFLQACDEIIANAGFKFEYNVASSEI